MAALRASYHRILNKIEHMLPAKLRPLYNHPAGIVQLGKLFGMLLGVWCGVTVQLWRRVNVYVCDLNIILQRTP